MYSLSFLVPVLGGLFPRQSKRQQFAHEALDVAARRHRPDPGLRRLARARARLHRGQGHPHARREGPLLSARGQRVGGATHAERGAARDPPACGATSREAAPIRSTPDLSTRRSRTCSPAPRRDHPQPRRGRDAGRPGFSAVGPVTMAGLPLPGATLDVTSSWARALVRAPERSSWRFGFVLVPVWPGLRRRPC
jgi:hypothetical protein